MIPGSTAIHRLMPLLPAARNSAFLLLLVTIVPSPATAVEGGAEPTAMPLRLPAAACSPSPKKGVGLWAMNNVDAALRDLRVAWNYDWKSSPAAQAYTPPADSAFVPMIWDERYVTAKDLDTARRHGPLLLGFNEPDRANEANLTVEQALDLWPQLMATGLRLGSPAPAAHADQEGSWLDRFMKGAAQRNLRVDVICVHWYGPTQADYGKPVVATAQLRRFIESVHARYRRPVWLTEFALRDWSTGAVPATLAQQEAFIRTALPVLESLPCLERYAWFCLPPCARYRSQLAEPGGALSQVGIAYRDMAVYPAGIPDAPRSLTAQADAPNRITLRWTDAATNDAGVRIERRMGDSSWSEIGALFAPDQTRYEDNAVPPGSTCTYRVRFFNHDGSSPYSNQCAAEVRRSAGHPPEGTAMRRPGT